MLINLKEFLNYYSKIDNLFIHIIQTHIPIKITLTL